MRRPEPAKGEVQTDAFLLLIPIPATPPGALAETPGHRPPACAAHQVIAGPVAIFSPVDPLLQAATGGGGEAPSAIAAQDVRLFSEMTRDWFGAETDQAQGDALAILCGSIFPTTLTSFYRSCLETREVCLELRALAGNTAIEGQDAQLVDRLIYGRHSHAFALSRKDMVAMGLPVHPDMAVEDLAWEIAREILGAIGAGNRVNLEDSWIDIVFATREGVRKRERNSQSRPVWRRDPVE